MSGLASLTADADAGAVLGSRGTSVETGIGGVLPVAATALGEVQQLCSFAADYRRLSPARLAPASRLRERRSRTGRPVAGCQYLGLTG